MTLDILLEKDLRWREEELASLKRLAINAAPASPSQRGLLRAMWTLLYAHFEGFTKFCWDTILDHIQKESVPTNALSKEFALLALESAFKNHRANLESLAILEFFDGALPAALSTPAFFPDAFRLKTESNLWPNIFERESMRLGIQCDELRKSRARIKALVDRRNDIAHGKSMTIATVEEYHEYENATFCLMHELAIKSMEIVDQQKYRKTIVCV